MAKKILVIFLWSLSGFCVFFFISYFFSHFLFQPYDIIIPELRPPEGTFEREFNDFFEAGLGQYVLYVIILSFYIFWLLFFSPMRKKSFTDFHWKYYIHFFSSSILFFLFTFSFHILTQNILIHFNNSLTPLLQTLLTMWLPLSSILFAFFGIFLVFLFFQKRPWNI